MLPRRNDKLVRHDFKKFQEFEWSSTSRRSRLSWLRRWYLADMAPTSLVGRRILDKYHLQEKIKETKEQVTNEVQELKKGN